MTLGVNRKGNLMGSIAWCKDEALHEPRMGVLSRGGKEVVWLRLDCLNPSSKVGRTIPLLVTVGKRAG
jgi:hypothetical protein